MNDSLSHDSFTVTNFPSSHPAYHGSKDQGVTYITTSKGCFRVTVRNGCPVIELEGRGSLLVAPKTAAKVEIVPNL